MLEAIALGALAQSALFIGGLLVYRFTFSPKVVGILAGFGAGALIEAVSFDLVDESSELSSAEFAVWMLIGAAILLLGDLFVERRFGEGGDGGGSAMGIVVGSIVDGVPESLIFGIQVATAYPISASFFAAVWISNFPQAIAPSADLAKNGWRTGRTARLWGGVVVACGLAAGIGYVIAIAISEANGDRAAALAAGGLLAMLTNSLMPFAFERAGMWAGVGTVVGFCLSVMASRA